MNIKIFKNTIYFSLYLCHKFSCAKRCDYVQTFKDHLKFYENSEELSHYIPRQSCFICVKPACFHHHQGCEINELKDLPFYHNMLEFGFLGNDLPVQANIRVPMSKQCYFLIEMNTVIGPEVDFSFWQCLYTSHDCTSFYHIPHESIREKDCIFVSIMLNRKSHNKIFVSVSFDCINLASAIRTSKTHQYITKEVCYFRGFNNTLDNFPTTHFKLYVESDSRHEGSVLVVPCSPGGYAVSPINGRFVYNYHCKSLFFPEVHGDALEQIIRSQYSSQEHMEFPKKEGPHDYTQEGLRPIFIDKEGHPKSPKEMQPKRKAYDNGKKPDILRDRCDLYEKLPYKSLEDAIDSNNIISTKKLDPSTLPKRATLTTAAAKATTTTSTTTTKKAIKTPPMTPKVTTSEPITKPQPPLTPPGGTFLPDVEQVRERVLVSHTNGSSSVLISFKTKSGVFTKLKTLAPGETEPPTPHIPLWTPDYEDLLEARETHSERRQRKAKFSRHHTPAIRVRMKAKNKKDILFERFNLVSNKTGLDYFNYLGGESDYHSNDSSIVKLTVSWFYAVLTIWIYKRIFSN